jgi:hypothetical protein
MYRAFWNFIGLASGWLGGKHLNGDIDYTPSLDGVMGVAGTFIGGVFICVSGICGSARMVLATGVAMICAALMATTLSKGSERRAIACN